jgi:hypothetical protein
MSEPPRHLALPQAAEQISDWGFLADPGQPGPGYLLLALRRHPTLAHFDPEDVEFWVTEDGRGVRMTIDHTSMMPFEREVSWGLIRITDRLRVSNEYLTFGGSVSADREGETTVAVFVSPAPLLRRGGHSQGWDVGAANLGAFFARLTVAAGNRKVEAKVAAVGPMTRYAAFVADAINRGRASTMLRDLDPATWRLLVAEERRIRDRYPAAWSAGVTLLLDIGAVAKH